jgi:hypothetical protein
MERTEMPTRKILIKLSFWLFVVVFVGGVLPTLLGFGIMSYRQMTAPAHNHQASAANVATASPMTAPATTPTAAPRGGF